MTIKNLALIPARQGSERLPGKNTIEFSGKPLIAWSIIAATKSEMFDLVAVSTDDQKVKEIAEAYNCHVIDRPSYLARPQSTSMDVVVHALGGIECDTVALLQPTSPFRIPTDIRNAYDVLAATGGDSVISVTQPPDNLAFEIGHANRLRPCKSAVVENGAIYLSKSLHLLSTRSWYCGMTYAYVMPKSRSIDIDTQLDLDMAREMARMGYLEAA